MKRLLHLVALAAIIYGSVVLWQKHRPMKAPAEPTRSTVSHETVPGPDTSVRTWTNNNGRSFEGLLVSAKNDRVIVRRQADQVCFLVPLGSLSPLDREFVGVQIQRAEQSGIGFVDEIPGYFCLSRKLDIKGHIQKVKATPAEGGSRNVRIDPSFWFLISPSLHGSDSSAKWLRVDERTFRNYAEGALLNREHLSAFLDESGELRGALTWPRPRFTPVDVRYGPPDKVQNVTERILQLGSQGALPVQIDPEVFDLLPHKSEVWELTIAWRTPEGEVRQTLRDGGYLNWP